MELLEADFAQIEHINQIIQNNINHDSWECFDTSLLLEQFPSYGVYDKVTPKNSTITKTVVDVRYNSLIVNIEPTDTGDGYVYTFEVINSLWDGTYKITRSKNNSTDSDENINPENMSIKRDSANSNKIIITLKGDNYKSIRVCFKMNMSGTGRNIQTSSIRLDNPSEYVHQYDETVYETGYVYTDNGEKVNGATVSITPCDENGRPITEGIPEHTIQKIKNGTFEMPYGAVKTGGDYYVIMTAIASEEYNYSSVTQMIHVKKVQKQSISIDWGEVDNYKNVFKGSIHKFEPIYFEIYNEYGIHEDVNDSKLKDVHVDVTFITSTGKRRTETYYIQEKNNKFFIEPEINYRGYYENYSLLELDIANTFAQITQQHRVQHSWFIANNYSELISEATDEKGADWIFIKPSIYQVNKTLNITRPLTLAGLKGESNCVLDGQNKYNIINIKNNDADSDYYMNVQLIGISLQQANIAVKMETGARLLVDQCYFTNNTNPEYHFKGCSIYMPDNDETKQQNKLWKLEVRNSIFFNNIGNEIQSIGKTLITNNLFKTTSVNCLKQPEVKVISVKQGNVTYKYNKSYINTHNLKNSSTPKPMASNHSFAKALAYVEKGATFNGRGPSQLGKDNSLPLYESPYFNEAYTYVIYYYPYSNVKTNIVCSPRRGKERQATGHGSSYKRWIYYDGYYFLRYENGKNKGNRNNPWTEKEIATPTNQGIYDENKDKFTEEYDPRFSNNKSLNSNI